MTGMFFLDLPMLFLIHLLQRSSAKLYLFSTPTTPVENFPPLQPQHLQTSPKTPRGVMYYNSFISVSMLQGQHPISAVEQFSPLRKVPRCHAAHYSAPRTDQPPAVGGRLVCLSCRTVIFGPPLRNKDIRAKSPNTFQD